jgi:hypothetical protein
MLLYRVAHDGWGKGKGTAVIDQGTLLAVSCSLLGIPNNKQPNSEQPSLDD